MSGLWLEVNEFDYFVIQNGMKLWIIYTTHSAYFVK